MKRLTALIHCKQSGFRVGVSLMPMLPFISDKGPQLESIFSTFAGVQIDYILPATLTLFGKAPSNSYSLVMKALEKHYPELLPKYRNFFEKSTEMPDYYREAFDRKTTELARRFGLKKSIL